MNEFKSKEMSNSRKKRIEIISVLYAHELLNENFNINSFFTTNEDISVRAFEKANNILKKYSFFKQTISFFLKPGWSWDRLFPILRSILLLASYELIEIPQPRIVINEAIEITKEFVGVETNEWKMINAILENIYKYYLKSEICS